MVKIKEKIYATEQGVQGLPEHTLKNRRKKKKKKNKFGVRVKGSRNLGLTEGDEQVSYLERYVWKSDWWGEKVSFLVRHLVLARHSCSSTSFVGSSVHLLSFKLRQRVRKSTN